MKTFYKDPQSTVDYTFDWGDEYLGSDTIATSTWILPTGLTNESDSISSNNKRTTVWISGGSNNQRYTVTNRITTNVGFGRTVERSMIIHVMER